jgi:hypothetical protein
MNPRVIARCVVIWMLLVVMIMPLNMALAQDDGGDDYGGDEPASAAESETGVEGIAAAADDFDVPAQPTPEKAQAVVNVKPVLPAFLAHYKPQSVSLDRFARFRVLQNPMKLQTTPKQMRSYRQCGEVIFEMTDSTGSLTLTAFKDNCVEVVDAQQVTLFTGYFGRLADSRVILVLTDDSDNQYALHNDHLIGLTADGDVLLGSSLVTYTYDYDKGGNFLGLTDSEGNDYDLSVDDDGNIVITDTDGNTGEFHKDGTFAISDEAGKTLEEGDLFGDNEADGEYGGYGSEYGGYGSGDYSGGGDYASGGGDYSSGGSDYTGSSDYTSGGDYSGGGSDYTGGGDASDDYNG